MRRPLDLLAVVAFFVFPASLTAQTLNDPALSCQTYATGLVNPTGLAFIPGSSDALVIEKNSGRVRRVNAGGGGVSGNILDLPVHGDSERGLLGIAIDPAFATNRNVYLYYSATTTGSDSTAGGTWLENRLSRFTLNAGGTALTGESVVATFGSNTDGQSPGANHNGGPIGFGLGGQLYGVTGDLNRSRVEQNQGTSTSALVGGIYRLDKATGNAAAGNPFADNANANFHRWYAYGVRNSFGMAFDPLTGNLWDTENGPDVMDEINLVAPGFNSGWSQIMGPDARDAQNVSDLVMLPGATYSDPEFSFASPIGITAIEFLAGSALMGYDDAVIVGNNNLGTMHVLRLNAARTGFVLSGNLADLVADSAAERNSIQFSSGFGATTDLQIGPDGALYSLSYSTGVMHRIIPEPAGAAFLGLLALALRRRLR